MLQLVSKKKFYSGRKSKYGYYYIYSVVDGSNHYLKSFRIAYRYPGFDNDSNEYEYYFDYFKG